MNGLGSSAGLVFVGSYTPEQHGTGVGISSYRRDGDQLDKVGEISTPAPSYLIADPRLPVVYAANEVPDGMVSSYAVDSAGGLTLLSSQPTGGADPCHLALRDGYLITANYSGGSVAVHPVDDAGRIGAHTDVIRHEGRGTNPERQDGPHCHFVHLGGPAGSAAGDALTVVDLGLDRLQHYTLKEGRLTPAGETVAPAGSGPRHLAQHPNGNWYVVAELEAGVLTFATDPDTGWLTHTSTGPATACTPDSANQPSHLTLSADGRRLYLANRGPNTIATFEVRVDGTLRALRETGTGGDWPRHFAIVDDLLFVANQKSDTVVAFRLDPASGLPEQTGAILDVPTPACVLIT